ncbi:MAG: hypothetical protein F6K00_23230 [Leptolyngbya sp. SIOISBB]|nr:hypothetical protein [Leptolyngbya sp. SIOISBB]
MGDWFNHIRLLGGTASDEPLAIRTSGELLQGSSATSNSDIVITPVTYPNPGSSNYFNFGPTIPIWQIDFHNLNWVIEGGRRYNFSVQGIGRQFLETEYSHAWYNHASNAALSGTPQQGADDLMSAFSHIGEFLYIIDAEEGWNKSADLNIQIFGNVIEGVEEPVANDDDGSLVAVVHNLNEAGLLDGKAYNRTLREVEQGIIRARSSLLQKLVVEQSGARLFVSVISPSSESANSPEVQALLAQMHHQLEQLNNTGVLRESVYNQLQNEINSGYVPHASVLYRAAVSLSRREEAVDPELVKPQLDDFQSVGILSAQGYTSLLEALEASELPNPIEFLRYIDRAQVLDLNDYSLDPQQYFPAIYQSVAQMLYQGGLINGEIGEFNLELILDEVYEFNQSGLSNLSETFANEWRTYDAVVSVQIDDRTYQQSNYYSPPISERDFLSLIDREGLVDLFNKVLRDQSSPYRLFSIPSFDYTFIGNVVSSEFGVIALTEAQADVYWERGWHGTDYANTFTSDRIAEIITLLEDIELLDHLSEAEISEGKKQIARQYITHPYQLLSAFKDVIVLFDWESAEGENPYKYFLEELARLSQGNFNPTDIDDGFDWENQIASVAFTLNGTRYSTDLVFDGDWLDPSFFEFVESVAAIEVPQGRFYPLSYYGHGTEGYIFLSDRQFEALRMQQLITLATDERN